MRSKRITEMKFLNCSSVLYRSNITLRGKLPWKPGGQVQVYPVATGMQVAEFSQGFRLHMSKSDWNSQ